MIFKDKNLVKALSNKENIKDKNGNYIQLKFKGNEIISKQKIIDSVIRIDLINIGIENISGIEIFTNLERLGLSNNKIKTIISLKKLVNLKKLMLADNQIENISSLKNLINLEQLFLGNNKIKDITLLFDLSNLKNLKYLDLRNNDLGTLATNYYGAEKFNKKYKGFNISSIGKNIIIKKI